MFLQIPTKFRSYDAKVRTQREGPGLKEYMEKARSLTREGECYLRSFFRISLSSERMFCQEGLFTLGEFQTDLINLAEWIYRERVQKSDYENPINDVVDVHSRERFCLSLKTSTLALKEDSWCGGASESQVNLSPIVGCAVGTSVAVTVTNYCRGRP